jgi:putative transposase
MCDATGLSQRRACRLTGLSLSTCRYEAQRPAADAHLSGRITELALERRRFGYRRIWQLLRREGLHVNHKRVYRLYHLNGLGVKRRRRRKGLATERLPLLRPEAPNLTWPMDFVMDALATGRRIKCLTCGRLHEGASDNYRRLWDFRRSGHANSGQHCTVSRLSGDDKN